MKSLKATLSDYDARRALGAFQAIAVEDAGYGAFVRHALDQLAKFVGSDLTTLSLCDLESGTRTVIGRRGEAISEPHCATFNRYFHEHPLVRYHSTHPGGPTQRITDCISQQAFRRSPLFSDYYHRIGINYVVALPLRIDDANVISVVFNRSSSNFTDAERAMLDVLRDPLAVLYRNIVAREEARVCQSSLQGIVASNGWHLVTVGNNGRVIEMSEAAARLLRHFFADAPIGARGDAPDALANWLRRRSRNWGLDRLQATPYTVARSGMTLTVHFIADPLCPEHGHLLMRQERAGLAAREIDALPLTLREREVLALVAAGKTNSDIAAILGISPRTVQKHLEHVFDKLGVETRTAAALRALAAAREGDPDFAG